MIIVISVGGLLLLVLGIAGIIGTVWIAFFAIALIVSIIYVFFIQDRIKDKAFNSLSKEAKYAVISTSLESFEIRKKLSDSHFPHE